MIYYLYALAKYNIQSVFFEDSSSVLFRLVFSDGSIEIPIIESYNNEFTKFC